MYSYYDVVIIGGGIIGVLCSIGLENSGISVLVIEAKKEVLTGTENRVYAINRDSKEILEALGGWNVNVPAAPIEHVMIYDKGGSSYIHYDSKYVDSMPMGHVVDAEKLSRVLKKKMRCDVFVSSIYETIETRGSFKEIFLSDGKRIKTSLVVCAEGKNSGLRGLLGMKTFSHDFGQSCIVCNIEHERNHRNTAIEHFYPVGPFAILPMYGGCTSSIVWTENTKATKKILEIPEEKFRDEVEKRCVDFIGKIKLKSKPQCFDITLSFLKKKFAERTIFIGDSAHTIHPVAGQGLNLGIRDVEVLVNILKKYHTLGSDLGQEFILREIEDRRLLDNVSMALVTTFVNSVFSSNSAVLKAFRRFAMATVEISPLAKRKLITHAMGLSKMLKEG